MKQLLIISDTHGNEQNLKKVLLRYRQLDGLIHLGDVTGHRSVIEQMVKCPSWFVAGNCDYGRELPPRKVLELEGHRLFLTHGHQYDVSYGDWSTLRSAAKREQCTVALFGHIHCPVIDASDPDVLVLNPGSLSLPRQEGHAPSFLLLELERGKKPQPFLQLL